MQTPRGTGERTAWNISKPIGSGLSPTRKRLHARSGVPNGGRPELFSTHITPPKHMSPIAISINITKVPEGTTFKGKKGEYLNLVLLENRDGTDQYGNDGFAKIEVSKADRESGKRGEIVGNWKFIGKATQQERPF